MKVTSWTSRHNWFLLREGFLRTVLWHSNSQPVSNFGGANNLLFWEDPFSLAARRHFERLLPVAPELRRTAEDALTVFKRSEQNVPRNADTLKSLEFAALKLDAL